MLSKIYLSIIFSCFVNLHPDVGQIAKDTKITVIGKAENSKASAVVVTDSGFYYIDALYRWDEKYYGKTVKVTGTLETRTYEKQSTPDREVQEIVGTVNYLKKAKWSLVE